MYNRDHSLDANIYSRSYKQGFFVGRVLKWLEKLTANTDSEVDDALLESLKKPLGYIPMTVALYFIAVYLPLSGMADTFATNLIKAMIAFTIFSALAHPHQNQRG